MELGEIGQREGLEDVAQGVIADRHQEHDHQAGAVAAEQFLERLFGGAAGCRAVEFRRFRQALAHPDADHHQHGAEQEGNAPAAALQEGVAAEGQQVDREGRQQQAEVQAERRPGTLAAAPVVAGMLVRGDGGAGKLGAGAQALQDADDDQQQRGPEADRRVGRNQADGGRADTHQEEGHVEQLLAAEAVAEVAEQHAAQRARHEADGEGGKCHHRRGGRVRGIEEHLAEHDRCHRRVQIKVVPLEHRADDGRGCHPLQAAGRLFRRFPIGFAHFHECLLGSWLLSLICSVIRQ